MTYRGLLCDLDGVVYRGATACDGAVAGLQAAREAGLEILFLTNNAARLPQEVARQLRSLGVQAEDGEVLNSSQIAASYLRRGLSYRAWILIERLPDVRSLADLVAESPADAPWEQTGRLIARFHRAGLDHADLNAHNILFDSLGKGWLIDLDRGQLRIPETRWRARNLARLERSLLKLRGARAPEAVAEDFARLRRSYDTLWSRGT